MRPRAGAARSSLLAALLFSGCVATQRDVLELSEQTDSLSAQIQGLKKTMSSLQANQAELAVKLDQVHQGLGALAENLKDNQEGMSRLGSKMDDLGAALGSKVSSLDQSLAQQKRLLEAAQEEARRKREAEDEARRKAEEEAARRKAAEAAAPSPTELFRTARAQLSRKEYDLAEKGLALYLEKFPKGEMADEATFYLGQAHFERKKWPEAAKQFALVLDRWPKSDLTASARLKYAMCLINMKAHLDEARRYLESIPEDFPKSPEAAKAAQLAKDWDKKFPSTKKQPATDQ